MAKRGQQRKYSGEFKIGVIMDMREHRLGYRETARKYWDVSGGQEINYVNAVKRWERLSPVLDLFNREIISYSISLSPNLQQVKDMLSGLFAKMPDTARPVFHSDQGWQYQHAEYQRLLAEHNITQSMSRKGNCMDNGAMENFFGRLKVEMFYGEQFETVEDFIHALDEYIYYYNNERISLKLKGMSPVQYRTHSKAS